MNWKWSVSTLVVAVAMGCGSDEMSAGPEPSMPVASMDDPAADPAGADTSQAAGAAEGAPEPMQDPSVEAMDPALTPGEDPAGAMDSMGPAETEAMEPDLAFDECGLDTGYDGDEYCILPPPPDQGFQMHIGPSDYENPDPSYVLAPGAESTDNFGTVAGNTEAIHFYYRQYRMRPGAHHMIASQGAGGFGSRRIATSNNVAEDMPPGGVVAPENEGVGVPLPANAPLNVSLHSINVTDEPILRELWVNFWYVDSEKVTQEASQLFEVGDPRLEVQPGEHTILGPYRCNIDSPARMLWFYGHRHANNVRFSAWRVRGDQRDLFYEGFDWEDVMVLQYSSIVDNPVPNRELKVEGGWSGPLEFEPGDQIEWECEVQNVSGGVLRFSNNTYTGEMCIMDGELVGANCSGGAGGFLP